MWQRFVEWIKSFFKRTPEPGVETSYAAKYEDITGENVTATMSNALASKVYGDSTFQIDGEGKRVEMLRSLLDPLWEDDLPWITAQAFGKGGMVLVPTVTGGEVVISAANQERLYITGRRGRKAVSAVLLAESVIIDKEEYQRWMYYALDENGSQMIQTVVTNCDGVSIPFETVPAWADIEPEITIGGTDRLLIAFIKCPRDNRKELKAYGVPISYGAEREIVEAVEHYNIYRREYKLTRPMLGMSASLWRNKKDSTGAPRILDIDDVARTVQDGDLPFVPIEGAVYDEKTSWPYFAPAIRQEAMEARMQSLYRRLEKACGLSQGVLTERQTVDYANKDEVRAAQYDTFAVVMAMRQSIKAALVDLAYSADVLAERFGLTPAGARGNYELKFDWDYTMIESSEQTWKHLIDLQTRGAYRLAQLYQWENGGTLDDAQAAVDDVEKFDGAPALDFGVDDATR